MIFRLKNTDHAYAPKDWNISGRYSEDDLDGFFEEFVMSDIVIYEDNVEVRECDEY